MFNDLSLIFDFRFNPYSLISLSAIFINLVLLILIQIRGVKNETNRLFILVPALVLLWAVAEFLDRSSTNPNASLFWDYIGRPAWIFLSVIMFSFTISFIGKGELLKSRIVQLLIFGPGLVFLFLAWNTNLILNNNVFDNQMVYWGWSISPLSGNYFWMFVVWLETYFIISLILLLNYYRKIVDPIRKKQTLFAIIAVSIPLAGGSITDAILPILNIQIMPLGVAFSTGIGIAFSYTIVRSNLFLVNPTLTANTIVDSISQALVVTGPDNIIEQINNSTSDLLGYEKDELVGQNLHKLLADQKTWENFVNQFVEPIKTKKIIKNYQTEFKTKTGKIIPISFSAVAIIEANRLTSIVGLANDVSAEREFEVMKTGFVIMAAHELRTPLTSIIGYLSVLKDEQKNFNDQQKSYLNKADVSTNHLSALIENLLSILGIDRGGLRLNLEVVNWKTVLEETIKNFSQSASEKNIKISIVCPDNLPKIKVDKFRISQVVSAILDNAIKNTDPKGKVTVSSKITDDKIETSINDTGHGIPQSALPNLFTKFFQVSPVLKSGGQGTGLSLFIAKAIVKMHHGKIWAESQVGVGSTFYFTLPISS